MTEHGLVIGKFYPPHRGHHLLIRTAAAVSRRVTVVVMAATAESISLQERVDWLCAVHANDTNVHIVGIMDDVPIDYHDASIWDAHVALMRQALQQIAAPTVTAVFTSEPYGQELAHRFNARAVTLDVDRRLAAISATAVRENLEERWETLEPPTRAGLALRVVIVGAESSGTTTLTRDLQRHLQERGGVYANTAWVPEYGRQFTIDKWAVCRAAAQLAGTVIPPVEDIPWTTHDFVDIAKRQNEMEQQAAERGSPILLCDTDTFATSIWHERYMNANSAEVDNLFAPRPRRLYLLTDIAGVDFEQDGLRDGLSIRGWMHERFAERLATLPYPFKLMRGSREDRIAQALEFIHHVSKTAWSFAPAHPA